MYKGLRRIVVTAANEQMIEKRSSLFRKEEQHQLLVRMNKKQKKIVVVATNEQRIEKRNFLFKEK